ncbi:MAG TPA: AMP-binding protein [Burkholderiaceae bacterium]|nr:AMP-binding protein [Burkholderiaceae bacterium]
MSELLIAHRHPNARIAVRNGESISAGCFLAAAQALAQQLPPAQYVLNTCRDRYHFAIAFCAALIAGRTTLLPPSRTPETLAQLATRYPDTLYVGEEAADIVWHNAEVPKATWRPDANRNVWPPPSIGRDLVAAIAFTSGSTGEPQPHPKTWGGIVDGAHAEIVALELDVAEVLDDVVLVGTVSPQHMYGLESTVMMALHGPCAFAAEHPLHSDEVVAVLSRTNGRRVLITAPVHLRALVESAHPLPTLDRVVSATAPLAIELAKRCESIWHTRVFEVYGCTETGMVATRRTVHGAQWKIMRDVTIERSDDGFRAHGGHVQPGMLADRLRLIDDSTFELEGRADDVVNIGGKRASLQGLNRALLSIDGVIDGAIFEPPRAPTATREQRLMALVVAPHLTRAQLLAALRAQIDPVFLPRPLLWVDALPRNAQGKLPKAELLTLAEQTVRGSAARDPAPRNTVSRTMGSL